MTSDELLQAMQAQGLLDTALANRLKRDALISGESIENVIAKQRAVDDVKIAELKSSLLKVPYKKVSPGDIDAATLALIPEETARSYETIPISFQENLLVVGMLHPDDPKTQDAIKFIARQNHVNLGVYLVSYGDWEAVLRKYSPYRTEIAKAVQSLNVKEGEGGSQRMVSLEDMGMGAAGEEAPVIKIVADTFREAVLGKASDIHIEPQQTSLRIRFRNDGDLHQVASLPVQLAQPIVSRVKVISNLKIDEQRVPQDGRFRARIFDRDIDFRVATFPTPLGEKVAIRVLDPSTGLKSFENLPLRYGNLEIVKAGLERPFGMVLITGPTGSGKTTTLYAFLQTLNQEDVNIVSLEDPVEYFVAGINQSQVHPEIGYDFASGLRQILRQDPDIIMVGEIRDAETAGLAVQAALTGHVVLSTLHTNNAAGVIPRLIDMKVEPFLIPVSVNLMMGQRLVGQLCPDCKFQEEPSVALEATIKRALEDVRPEIKAKYPAPHKVYHTKGCNTCKGKGILGRMALYEVFRMTPALEEIVAAGATIQKIVKEAKSQGMITLRQDGVMKALDGLVLMEEVIRETEEA
jgi:type IV pilus assembly protein PilB